MIWLLMAWLCTADGDCRPVQAAFPTRGACIRAERVLKRQPGQVITPHCHRRPDPVS